MLARVAQCRVVWVVVFLLLSVGYWIAWRSQPSGSAIAALSVGYLLIIVGARCLHAWLTACHRRLGHPHWRRDSHA